LISNPKFGRLVMTLLITRLLHVSKLRENIIQAESMKSMGY